MPCYKSLQEELEYKPATLHIVKSRNALKTLFETWYILNFTNEALLQLPSPAIL
jgi:hypothetical protein